MRRSTIPVLCLALALPVSALAASEFDGTWKANTSTEKLPSTPDRYLLAKGAFACLTCEVKAKVPADGASHPVSGSPYYDAESVKVVDDKTVVVTRTKDGKQTSQLTLVAGDDGKTLTESFVDNASPNGQVGTGMTMSARVGAAPAGAHAISGTWRATSFSASDNFLTFTIAIDGDTVSVNSPAGQSYTAKLGGPDAPFAGDPGVTSVSVRRTGPHTIVETDKRDGKVVSIATMTVSADGKTLSTKIDDKVHGSTMAFDAAKQ
ncbi:MAG TPA: hypothetical protein VKS60_18460 [Stellaceae bacterium]|nr:hypothetical protein [Stellaceae bacterium]